MTELPINEYICNLKSAVLHSKTFMRSKSQNSLDLHISKWKLTLHYFVEFSSRKQSNISERLKKGMF